jgi:DNA-binding beta-propeller fold protein YncE
MKSLQQIINESKQLNEAFKQLSTISKHPHPYNEEINSLPTAKVFADLQKSVSNLAVYHAGIDGDYDLTFDEIKKGDEEVSLHYTSDGHYFYVVDNCKGTVILNKSVSVKDILKATKS